MTWIKPNLLWMMYRSDWGRGENQEVTLAVRILRSAFDDILDRAVHSSFKTGVYQDPDDWKAKLSSSDVRLQWDPDHGLSGEKLARRAIQLGLRGAVAANYARDWVVEIEDISGFVATQREHASDETTPHSPHLARTSIPFKPRPLGNLSSTTANWGPASEELAAVAGDSVVLDLRALPPRRAP